MTCYEAFSVLLEVLSARTAVKNAAAKNGLSAVLCRQAAIDLEARCYFARCWQF